jgi:hypothetical protein
MPEYKILGKRDNEIELDEIEAFGLGNDLREAFVGGDDSSISVILPGEARAGAPDYGQLLEIQNRNNSKLFVMKKDDYMWYKARIVEEPDV